MDQLSGVSGLAPLVLRVGVVASLVWGLLWRVALAEGVAASASFCVTGCTEECGGSSIYGWGCLPWRVSNWGGCGLWHLWGVRLSGVFWKCMLLPPTGLWFSVFPLWCILGGCVGSPESRLYPP